MSSRDPRIDTYIINSADFAIPILDYLRETVHAACPEVKETMKWSMPFFELKGPVSYRFIQKSLCFWFLERLVNER